MQFYKKIFTAFFVLLTITTRVAVGDDGTIIGGGIIGGIGTPITPPSVWPDPIIPSLDLYPVLGEGLQEICSEDEYITECDFHLAGDDPSTPVEETSYWARGIKLNPENVFAFIASKTGYLCWDFDNPETNYYNLHILFGADPNATMECYFGLPDTPASKLYLIRMKQKPVTAKYVVPYEASDNSGANYGVPGMLVKQACQARSVVANGAITPPKDRYCAKCPNKNSKSGHSKGAFANVVGTDHSQTATWTEFSTIADCYYWDDDRPDYRLHEDNTGWFKYPSASDGGPCYYSGE